MGFLVLLLLSLLGLSSCSSISSHRSVSDVDLAKFTTQKQVSSLFQLWKSENGRVYQNKEEEAQRLEIFKNNLNYIRDVNANRKSPRSHSLGLNKFADITPQEFSKKYLQAPKNVTKHINNMAKKVIKNKEQLSCDDAPESWDWSKKDVLTEVKYQGQCGSGWAFSATGAIEAAHAIATGNLISLSEQELVDCVEESEGCYNGWHYQSFEWVVEHGGIATDDDYPYRAKEGKCKSNKIEGKVTIDGYEILKLSEESIESETTEKAFLCAILEQPISVSIDAKDFHFYTGGVYDGGNCTSPYGINHFVLLVGYGSEDGVDYWIAKNSWGKDWGMDGYIRIQRNTGDLLGVCGMNYFASYPIIEKSEDEDEDEEEEPLVSARVKAGRRVSYSTL